MRTFFLALFAVGLTACPQEVVVYPDGGEAGLDAAAMDVGGNADAGAAACLVDPFDACPDPMEATRTNDTWAEASQYSGSAGCVQGDDLRVLDGSVLGVMCPTEAGDYHALTLVSCDTRTLRLQVRLHMLTECPADKYELRLLFGGGVRTCGDVFGGETIRCTDEGPDRLIQLLIPPDRTVQPWYFGVLSDAPNVRFDYDLQVSVQ